ncbi:MAG: hypothetical protein ABWY06_11315 [Pseudomonas sp.]|uniref:hypothetical protein n=1 Tax=Pseudomonas sp. TaxID=306 RepID=UPI0033951030
MQAHSKILLFGCALLISATAAFVWISRSEAVPVSDIPPPAPSAAAPAGVSANGPAVAARVGQARAAQPDHPLAVSDEQLLAMADSNPDYPTLADRLSEVSARRDGQHVDVAALYAATRKSSAWEPLDSIPEGFPLSVAEQYDGRQFIQVDPMKIESLVPGDTLDIDIGQLNQSFTAVIDNVQAQPNNNVTWTGHLKDMETPSQVVFTRGESLIVAGITTPQGHFEMEARGNKGWIVNSATLFKTPDVLIEVPREELAKTPATLPPAPVEKNLL